MALNQAIGTLTVPTSGSTCSITGLSFQPDLILFIAAYNTAEDTVQNAGHDLLGAYDGTNQVSVRRSAEDGANWSNTGRWVSNTECAGDVAPASGYDWSISATSMNSDGASFTISNNPTSAINLYFLALGGVNAEVGTGTHRTGSAGTKQFTLSDATLDPAVLIVGAVSYASVSYDTHHTTAVGDIGIAVGTGSTEQYMVWNSSWDAQADSTSTRGQLEGYLFRWAASDETWDPAYASLVASLSAKAAGSFTLNYTQAPSSAGQFIYIAIDGVQAELFEHTQPTTNTTSTQSHGFTPEVAFLSHWGRLDQANPATGYRQCFGFSNGTTHRSIDHTGDDGAGVGAAESYASASYAVALNTVNTNNTYDGFATLAFSTNQSTLTWTGVDGTQRTIRGVVFADEATGGTTYERTLSESIEVNDLPDGQSRIRERERFRSIDEKVELNDAVRTSRLLMRLLSDSVLLEDQVVATLEQVITRILFDNVAVSDELRRNLLNDRRLSEAMGVQDALTIETIRTILRSLTDAFALTDSITAEVAGVVDRVLRDQFAIVDTLIREVAGVIARYLVDTITFNDAVRKHATHERVLSSSAEFTDTLARWIIAAGAQTDRYLLESFGVTDSVLVQANVARLLADSYAITDGLSRDAAFRRLLNDYASVSDSIILDLIKYVIRVLADQMPITDVLRATFVSAIQDVGFIRFLADSLYIVIGVEEEPIIFKAEVPNG